MNTGSRAALVMLCFFLSGAAGLVYQIAWTRQFAFVFGTSELAVAAVLAAFMGGLAVGAAVAARMVSSVRRPLLVYALLELGVALAALAVPAGIQAAAWFQSAVFGSGGLLSDASSGVRAGFDLASSLLILSVPTSLMGATLPLLVRYAVRNETEIGARVGALYAVNTAGAMAGAVAAGFALLPELGLQRTVWVGVASNALVSGVAMLLALASDEAERPPETTATDAPSGGWILPLVLVSGAVSFTYEVLWSRLLGHLIGGSAYGVAAMLASFLAGNALGAALAARVASDVRHAARGFAFAQLGTAFLSLLAFAALDQLPALLSGGLESGQQSGIRADAILSALLLLPSALCIGATFPFAVRVVARSAHDAAPATARTLAWNTLGAIAGATGAGFVLIPALGFAGALGIAAATNALLAITTLLRPPRNGRLVAAVCCAAILCAVLARPETPENLLRASPFSDSDATGRIAYLGVGRSATVLVLDVNGMLRFRNNGLPESLVVQRGGSASAGSLDRWLATLPSLARPEARRLLVVGLGGGAILEAVPPSIEAIDVVEIESEVIEANRAVASLRRWDPLADPRVRLVVDDARSALRLSDESWDAIVSQPSHPWTSGSSHLFTREFFEIARAHLTPQGVLVQWMGLAFVDEPLLRTLVATLIDVFPSVRVYHPTPGGVLLLASAGPVPVEANAVRAIAAAPRAFAEAGIVAADDVAAALVLDEAGARAYAAGAPINTDDRNLLQMRSFELVGARRSGDAPTTAMFELDALLDATPELDRAAIVRKLLERGFAQRARRVAEATQEPLGRATSMALIALAENRGLAARRALEVALRLDPRAQEARAAAVRMERRAAIAGVETNAAIRFDAAELAVLAGWRGLASQDWEAVRSLDPQLAKFASPHPLFPHAARVRVQWRLASRDAALAREAVEIADPLVAVSTLPGDLVLRARAQLAASDEPGAVVTLYEAARSLGRTRGRRGAPPPAAAAALRLLEDLPPGEQRERLRELF